MKKTTIIIVIAILFISLYAMQEVSYFSYKTTIDKNISTPVLKVPSINLDEKANFNSLSEGVMIDELSSKPNEGKIIFHGHRTLLGSPFFRLNEVKPNDTVIVDWAGVGEVNYTVTKTYIVPASHTIEMGNMSKTIYLITCDPIGTSINRLIVEAEPVSQEPLVDKYIVTNPNENYSNYIAIGFLAIGLIFSYLYPIKEDRKIILIEIIVISIVLFGLCFFPVSPAIFGFLGFLGF
ncbi:MAG: sortase [Methanobrevibacter sp.]|jgi:LPXTG-site transpeptidase (sortase) family protein|nr:sortase [Candidatus Methanoflexus mossambicus]